MNATKLSKPIAGYPPPATDQAAVDEANACINACRPDYATKGAGKAGTEGYPGPKIKGSAVGPQFNPKR